MGGEEPAREDVRLADAAGLRRVERFAVTWTVIAGGALWGAGAVAGAPAGGALPAVVLTAVAVASIVAFRGLQRIVSALGPATPVPARSPDTRRGVVGEDPKDRGSEEKPGKKKVGWRQGLAALVRLCLLGALLITGTFLLGPRFFPALVLGFSTLPAALMTEGLLQLVRALRREDHDGVS